MTTKQKESSGTLTDATIFKAYSVKYAKYLKRLPKKAIIDLALAWLNNSLTEPHLLWDDYQMTGEDLDDNGNLMDKRKMGLQMLKAEYVELYNSTITKKELIERLLLDHWSDGLNMLQIADIDIAGKSFFKNLKSPLKYLLIIL
jgi:hypothetical protein